MFPEHNHALMTEPRYSIQRLRTPDLQSPSCVKHSEILATVSIPLQDPLYFLDQIDD